MPEAHLNFTLERLSPERSQVTITLSSHYVHSIYQHVLKSQRNDILTYGFNKGSTPLAYFESAFKHNIIEHLKDVLFTHCVINLLYKKLDEHKITLAGEPRVESISLDPSQGASYIFNLTHVIPPLKYDWKRLPFKAPTRKNYKDLDRQVEFFITEEQERVAKLYKDEIGSGDWVFFSMVLVDEHQKPLLENHIDTAWLRMSAEDVDKDSYELFAGRKVGDHFFSSSDFLQKYISCDLDAHYFFCIEIKDRVPHAFFSLDHFKRQFKLKSTKDIHVKLIEVFSFRNDISQRRETVTAILSLLVKSYPFQAPEQLIHRQKEMTLRSMQSNPDYHVYKAQPDFKNKIHMLAQKQVNETILIDYIAHQENIQATDDDIITYLNLSKRPRTKEFIYFDMPSFKAKGHETPIPAELIRHCCLQEKTLNHVICNLTKRA